MAEFEIGLSINWKMVWFLTASSEVQTPIEQEVKVCFTLCPSSEAKVGDIK